MVFASTVVLGGGGTFLGEVVVFMSVKVFLGGAGSQKGMPEAIASFFFTRFSISSIRPAISTTNLGNYIKLPLFLFTLLMWKFFFNVILTLISLYNYTMKSSFHSSLKECTK